MRAGCVSCIKVSFFFIIAHHWYAAIIFLLIWGIFVPTTHADKPEGQVNMEDRRKFSRLFFWCVWKTWVARVLPSVSFPAVCTFPLRPACCQQCRAWRPHTQGANTCQQHLLVTCVKPTVKTQLNNWGRLDCGCRRLWKVYDSRGKRMFEDQQCKSLHREVKLCVNCGGGHYSDSLPCV